MKRERKVTIPEPKPDIPGASARINVVVTRNELTLTGPSWSLRWASPEVVLGEDPDLPSDIWAMGWVVWEVRELDSETQRSCSLRYPNQLHIRS